MMEFVDDAGVWLVETAEPTPCDQCGEPATATFVAERAVAELGPGDRVFCDAYCWGKWWDVHHRAYNTGGSRRRGHHDPKWEQASAGLPSEGPQGISSHDEPGGVRVLTYRTEEGRLVGVLRNVPPGLFTFVVDPEYRGRRVGTKLNREAARRWGVNMAIQQWTEGGARTNEHAFMPAPDGPT